MSIKLRYALFTACFEMLVWMPVYIQAQRDYGLSTTQILTLQSLHYFAFTVFELPTGFFSDALGHGFSMRLGALIMALSQCFVAISPTFYSFGIHFVLLSLARSLVSGSAQAWLYETLSEKNQCDDFKSIEAFARSLSLTLRLLLWTIASAWLANHILTTYWFTALFGLLAYLIARSFHESQQSKISIISRRWAVTLELREFIQDKKNLYPLLSIFGLSILFFTLGRLQSTYFQPVLIETGFLREQLGHILTLITVFELMGTSLLGWPLLAKKISAATLPLIGLIMSLCLAFTGIHRWFGAFSLCLFGLLFGLHQPLLRDAINTAIPNSKARATILSAESLLCRSAMGLTLFLMSVFSKQHARIQLFATSLLLGVFFLIPYYPVFLRFVLSKTKRFRFSSFEMTSPSDSS